HPIDASRSQCDKIVRSRITDDARCDCATFLCFERLTTMSRVPFTPSTAARASRESLPRMPETASKRAVDMQAEWFDQARRGDRAAFARLVQALQDRLYNAVSRMVGQPDDAMEVTQETFAKAL